MNYVYLLTTPTEGVFYVGMGKKKRLKDTKYYDKHSWAPEKKLVLDRIKQRGEKISVEEVFSSEDRYEAAKVEYFLIKQYRSCICNIQGRTRKYIWPKNSTHKQYSMF
jgi:hypothetical protein